MKNWVIFQLSEKGEQLFEEEPGLIENLIKKNFKGEYFIPLYYDKNKQYYNKIFLFKGYIFLEHSEIYLKSYTFLRSTPYFKGMFSSKKIQTIPDSEVQKMKEQLKEIITPVIEVGKLVEVLDGRFKKLKGTILKYDEKKATVDMLIELKCIKIIATKIPIAYLKNADISNTDTDGTIEAPDTSMYEALSNDNVSTIKEIRKKKAPKKVRTISLGDRIIRFIKNSKKGLTREELVKKLKPNKKEAKQISPYLYSFTKKKYIKKVKIKKKKLKKGYLYASLYKKYRI